MTKVVKQVMRGIVNIDGGATYDLENSNVIFVPNVSVSERVERWRKRGTGMQMSDGTFEFVPRRGKASRRSLLLRKLAHGSLTEGRDNKIRLCLVFDLEKESVPAMAEALLRESALAADELGI